MRKLQLWSMIKEIASVIDSWDQETLEDELEKNEMTFAKYLPESGKWHKLERYIVRIKITKERIDEKENDTTKSTQSVEKG